MRTDNVVPDNPQPNVDRPPPLLLLLPHPMWIVDGPIVTVVSVYWPIAAEITFITEKNTSTEVLHVWLCKNPVAEFQAALVISITEFLVTGDFKRTVSKFLQNAPHSAVASIQIFGNCSRAGRWILLNGIQHSIFEVFYRRGVFVGLGKYTWLPVAIKLPWTRPKTGSDGCLRSGYNSW